MPKPYDRIGPYQLERKLGKGAFGEVWLAHDVDNLVATRAVALKLPLDDDVDLDAIRQEAQVWVAASGHPNVLPMLEARVYDGQVVIASEYAPDGSLQQWLKAHGGQAPTIAAALEMTRGILDGLAHLHSRRIIHRDLKPDNILLNGTTPRLADFGLSRVLRSTSMSAVVAGTPIYMAPEAFKGKRSPQTDLWSVGVMLYQMLSGGFPFISNDKYELYVRIVEDEPAPFEAPAWLQHVVAKALSKDPAQRFQSAEEFRNNLNEQQTDSLLRTDTVDLTTISRLDKLATPLLRTFDFVTARVNEVGHIIERINVQVTGFEEDLGDGIGLQMIEIPGGSFWMGSTEHEVEVGFSKLPLYYGEAKREWFEREMPRHRVAVPSFWMSRYQITQEQWWSVARLPKVKLNLPPAPAYFGGTTNLPVENVSWEEAVEFCQRLERLCRRAYRLPSEAEWEYACRAGSTAPFAFGPVITTELANYEGNYPYGKAPKGECRKRTLSVGSLGVANAFGLYDMHGYVWEWCEDVWHDNYSGAPLDGSAWLSGGDLSRRVLRGGCWYDSGSGCRSANRCNKTPGDFDLGFRVVMVSRTP